jgi:hypothetical protein
MHRSHRLTRLNISVAFQTSPAKSLLLGKSTHYTGQPRQQAFHLCRLPLTGPCRGRNAAPVQLVCDALQCRYAGRLNGFEDIGHVGRLPARALGYNLPASGAGIIGELSPALAVKRWALAPASICPLLTRRW